MYCAGILIDSDREMIIFVEIAHGGIHFRQIRLMCRRTIRAVPASISICGIQPGISRTQ